ncbi:MAG: type IV pilus assembly protein PilM [Candidatus Spechtbacterales bacterium]
MTFPTLFKITPEPFGLDLSDRSIKVANLSKKKGRFYLENFGEETVEEGLMEDGVIISEKKLALRIAKAVSNLKTGSSGRRYVACSLPEQKSFLHIAQLERIKKEEIEEAIQREIEANIPMKLADVYFDWEIIPSFQKSSEHFDILISAAPRDLVDSYNRLFVEAGLVPFSFEPESLALTRCLVKKGVKDMPVLIIDLGHTRTSFIIYAGGGIRFTSSMQISGNMMTENIKRDLAIDQNEAERLKKKVGLDRDMDKRVFEAIIPAITDLKQQIGKYMDFYSSHESHIHNGKPSISGILLAGGGACMRGLAEHLASSLKISVEIADPFVNIAAPPRAEKKSVCGEFIKYATAFGLAS